jgi:drug/metabolite transporter (DMT)-like permease
MIAFDVTFYSFLSGILACFVSISLKLAFNTHLLIDTPENQYIFGLVSLKLLLQVCFIGIGFGLNSFMWIVYTKGLQLSSSTLYTTSLNKLSNFICSAFCGYFLFEEKIKLFTWLIGIALLFIGILILNEPREQKQEKSKIKSE